MSSKIVSLLFWGILPLSITLYPTTLRAQDTTGPKKVASTARQHAVDVTGCLEKGEGPNEFAITGDDGKTWDLRSRRVKLSSHLGHKVTITGAPYHKSKEEEAQERKAGEQKPEEKENPHLRVTALKMISESCK